MSVGADFAVRTLVCPETRLQLEPMSLEAAEERVGRPLVARAGTPFARTEQVLLRSDEACAYPVLEQGIPVLLLPEMLLPEGTERDWDLTAPQYAEAYEEMAHYDAVAEANRRAAEAAGLQELERTSDSIRSLAVIAKLASEERLAFPDPEDVWVDATYDGPAQRDAYRYLAPVAGKTVLQLGGAGTAAVKFLLAGAAEATLVSPMPGELIFAQYQGQAYGVADRLKLVVGVAEELPFADGSIDVIFSGGSVHHMETSIALPECARVLRSGGRFAANDPWRAPLYALGTRLFGKRERDVFCRPLTAARVSPLFDAFDAARVVHHGTFTRYAMIALGKLGFVPSKRVLRAVAEIDDRIASVLRLRRFGSSVAVLGEVAPRSGDGTP